MRIHKLEITNIASLRGHHSIDFDKISKHSSLFAITGKTGSGKSSILNSISLALYGEVYKKGSTSLDFVCLGEAMGEITLYFSALNSRYKATWNLKVLKKNGEKLKKPQLSRSLYINKLGNYEAIDKDIVEITKLTFDQFCKTAILNQGEFSKFLTSSFTDRKDILEKFYNGKDLARINIELREKLKQKQNKITTQNEVQESIEKQIAEIKVNDSDIKTSEDKVLKLKSSLSTIEIISSSIKDFSDNYKTLCSSKEKIKTLYSKAEENIKDLNLYKTKLKKVQSDKKAHQDHVNSTKPKLEECIKKQVIISETKNRLNEKQNEKESLEKELESTRTKTKKFSLELQVLSLKEKELSNILIDINNESNIQKDFSTSDKYISLILEIEKNLFQINEKKNSTKTKVEELESNLKSLEAKYKNFTPNKLQEKQEINSEQIYNLKVLQQELTIGVENKKNTLRENKGLESTKNRIFEKKQELENAKVEIEKNILNAEQALKYSKLVNAIKLCIEENKKRELCVICNSKKNHDINSSEYLHEILTNQDSPQDNHLEDLIKKKYSLHSSLETHANEISSLDKMVLANKNKISLDNARLKKEWLKYQGLPIIENILSSDSINILESLIKNKTEILDKLNKEIYLHREDQIKYKNNKNNLTYFTQELNEQNNKYDDQKKELLEIRSKNLTILEKYKLDDTDLENSIKKFKYLSDIFQKKTHTEEKIDKLKNEKVNTDERLEAITNQINTIISQISKDQSNNLQLNKEIRLVTTKDPKREIDLIEIRSKEIREEEQQIVKYINDFEIQSAEINSKIQSHKEQINDCELLINKVIGKLNQINIGKAHLQETQMDEKEVLSIVNKILRFDISQEIEVEIFISTIKALETNIQNKKNSLEKCLSDLTRLKVELEQKNALELKIKNLKTKSSKLLEDFKVLDELNQLIGKDEFRNYVLSIIENQLIEQTNKELEIFCNGRYRLIQTNKTNKMVSEFKILDFFNGALSRKIITLSGGETFLVSLAMALALAELTRGTAQIDSIFIDEGFGTLDSDSINDVYDLLESIQHSGKQIGVISHISELTNRINSNIFLQKSEEGNSTIQTKLN